MTLSAKKSLLAIAAFAASLQPLAFAAAQGEGRGTGPAVQCLVRQGPKGCETMFIGSARTAARPWVYANNGRDFERGPLEFTKYFGEASQSNVYDAKVMIRSSSREMDIYHAKFAHHEWTFYVSPPDENGKIRDLTIRLYEPHDLNQLH
jgi:hypothetical protein